MFGPFVKYIYQGWSKETFILGKNKGIPGILIYKVCGPEKGIYRVKGRLLL